MASSPIWKPIHNGPLRSSASGDHFQETLEQSFTQASENDVEIAELSLYCSVQERERALCGRHSISRGSMTQEYDVFRVNLTQMDLSPNFVKPQRYSESDQRGDCERPIFNDTEQSVSWWDFRDMMECSSNLIKS